MNSSFRRTPESRAFTRLGTGFRRCDDLNQSFLGKISHDSADVSGIEDFTPEGSAAPETA